MDEHGKFVAASNNALQTARQQAQHSEFAATQQYELEAERLRDEVTELKEELDHARAALRRLY